MTKPANGDDLVPLLRNKTPAERAQAVQSILDVSQRGVVPLTAAERQTLKTFIAAVRLGRAVPETLLRDVDKLALYFLQSLLMHR